MLFHFLKGSLSKQRREVPAQDIKAIFQLVEAGDLQRAEADCRQLLGRFRDDPEVCRWMGRILGMTKRHDEAILFLSKTVGADPAHVEALADLGTVCWFKGDFQKSIHYYDQVLALDPHHPTALYNKSLILAEWGRIGEAAERMWEVLVQVPRHEDALRSYVRWMADLNRYPELRDNLEKLLALDEQAASVHEALGYVLLKRFYLAPESLNHFRRAMQLGMQSTELLGNLGIALQDVGKLDEALDSYNFALALDPENHSVRLHRALANLLIGNFEDGWADYEIRLVSQAPLRKDVPFPLWSGEDLAGKSILVSGEQGIGDEIMFASCLPKIIRRAGRCVIECAPKLEPIYRRSFPTATVRIYPKGNAGRLDDLPEIDFHVPVGSLPLHLRLFQETLPAPCPYLHADPDRVRYWKTRLENLGPGLKIGVSWRGGTEKARRDVKTCAPFLWTPIAQIPGVHFICLQYDATPAEADETGHLWGTPVRFWGEALENYYETAALVAALDVIVSVCTSLIHLAGALGTPVRVMAPLSPDWRYGLKGDRMVWYRSVRLFRQDRYGDWSSVVERVAEEIRRLARASQQTRWIETC